MGPEQVHRRREVVRIRPLNTTTKFLLMLGGVTVPVISHMAFVIHSLSSRSIRVTGATSKVASRDLLSFESLSLMYPLIAIAMICYAFVIADTEHHGRNPWIRFGVTTGIPVALSNYVIFLLRSGYGPLGIVLYHLAAAACVLIGWGIAKGLRHFDLGELPSAIIAVMLVLGITTFGSSIYVVVRGEASSMAWLAFPLLTLGAGSVLFGPLIWLGSLIVVLRRLHHHYPPDGRFSILWLMVWVTWLSVYFAASRYAMALQ